MEIRDLIVTPIYFVFILIAAYFIRPFLTDHNTRPYYFPALMAKILGAISLGIVYQFYYQGGDTYNFHTIGSRVIWEAFMDSPTIGLSLIFSDGVHAPEFFNYSSRIYFFSDDSSFFVIRVAAIGDLFTFGTYSATALFFAFYSFLGSWFLFLVFNKRYPKIRLWLAIGCLFIPSVFFWGSGLMKDTLVIGGLGFITWLIDELFIEKKISFLKILFLILLIWSVFSLKKFILQAYLPSAILWIYLSHVDRLRSFVLRVLVLPFAIILAFVGAYYAAVKIGEDDARYAIENIAKTSQVTARDIRFQSGRFAGSGYELSEYFDGTLANALRLAPEAINVTLFRPYLWEVKNPLMLMTALESLTLLLFTLFILLRKGYGAFGKLLNPEVAFTISYSLIYAFAIGVSTYNFGTLSRYKIPILPFFFMGLVILYRLVKEKSEEEEEFTNDESTVSEL